MPRKGGALHANGKRPDAPEDLELARQRTPRPRSEVFRHELMECSKYFARLSEAFALDDLGHHRGAGLGDGTALTLKGRVDDPVPLDLQPHVIGVAAERVSPFRVGRRILELSKVPWRPVMVEDDALIQLVELGAHPRTLRASASPATSASISSWVLYAPNEARSEIGR